MSDPGDAGNAEDRGQREKAAADSSASSQHGSSVTHHLQGSHKEQVRVSFVPTVPEEGINGASRLSTGLWTDISEASSLAGGQFQLTKERDEKYKEVSGHRDYDPVELQDIISDATTPREAEEGRNWEDDLFEFQDIILDATSTMEAEEGRKWARKGDDGWWSAISETAPWAGAKFVLTKERDDKYEGNYLSGHREDDSVQLQDVLRDATNFDILPPFSSEIGTSEFDVDSLQMAADKCQHFLFLVKSFADVLQMGDNPAPFLLRLSISGWAKLQHFSLNYGHTPTPEEKPVFEGARKRVLQAVRLMIKAAQTGKLNRLESLALVAVGLDDAGLQAVVDVIEARHFPFLARLFLDANVFGSKGGIALAQAMESRKLLRLETISLNNIGFGDDGCEAYEKAVSSGNLEALRKIHLSDNDIGDRGAQALARGFQSGRVKNLAELDLSWNRVGDDGMVALATSLAAGKFCELTKLNFRWNSFGVKGIQGLTTALESGGLNSLKKLSIENWRRLEEDAKPLIVAFSINKALTLDLGFDKSTCLSSQDGSFLTVHREGSAKDSLQDESFFTAHSEGSAKDCSQDRSFVTVHPEGSAKDFLQADSFPTAPSEAEDCSQDRSFATVHPEGSAKDSLQDESFITAHSEGSAKDYSQDISFVTVHRKGSAKDFLQGESFLTAHSEGYAKNCSQDRSFVTVHPEGSAKDSPHDGSFVMVRSEGSEKDSFQAEAFIVTPHPESCGKEQVWVPTGAMVSEEGRKWARKGDDGFWTAISEVAPWAGVAFKVTDKIYKGNYLAGYREDDLIQLQDILQSATHFKIVIESVPRDFSANNLQETLEQFVFLVERLADALQTGDEPTPLVRIQVWLSWLTCPHDSLDDNYTPTQEMKQVLEASRLRVLLAVRLIVEAVKLGKLNKIKFLSLAGVGLDDAGLQALSDVTEADNFPCLTGLYLGNNDFGLKGAIALAQAMESSKLLGLETLALESNKLGDDGCEAFERALSSGSLEALRSLYFIQNDVGDRGAQALGRGFQSGRVKKLAKLYFSFNRIGDDGMFALATSLAAGKCPALTELDVRYNCFSTKGIHGLAKALESGNLNSLLKLSISNGQRSEADAKPLVMALSVNQALTVDLEFDASWVNPGLSRQLEQLVERNSKYVQLLAQAGENFVPASFAKVYLCGNPEVGKTTLRKSMTETKSYLKSLLTRDREEPRTRGIEISHMTCRGGKDDKRDISLAFWDMAGQDEYHKLHSSFLSDLTDGKATIFLVVCTTQNIEKAEEELNYWLRFIASSVNQNVKNLRDVFLVVNRWGKNLKFNVDEWKHMVSTLSMKFQGHLNIKVDPFIVDVRKKPQVNCVADALAEHSREMLDDEMIPEICHSIQTDLNKWEETTRSFPVLSRAEFDQVLNRRGAKWDDKIIEAALVYLNEVGVLIYINKEFPPEWSIPNKQLVVLEPNWFCREIVGNMFLTRDMGGEKGDLFRSKVNTKTGSIQIKLFKDHFQALLGLWDKINVHDVLAILLWVGFCYKGHNENLFIPALIIEDDTPGDCWYGGNLGAEAEGQWVMGYCVEHAPDEKCLAPIALWHKFQVRLAQTSEFNDRYGGSDFVCGKYFVTFKARLMCVLVEVNAEIKRPTFDHIEVFVKPLLSSQIDDLDSNTRKQCQVDFASEVVKMLLDLWAQVCPGINSIQRVVWPWPSSQPRRPKTNLEDDMEVASFNKWVQERGVGRILQRLVGGTPISGDQLLSTKSKKLLLNSLKENFQGGKSRLGEAMTLGIFSSDLLEGVDLNEE